MRSLLKLMRLYYAIPMAGGFVVIVLYRIGGEIGDASQELVLSFLAVTAIIAGGYVLNDICDVAADRVNCPNRVLPRGLLSRKAAAGFSVFLFAVGLALAIGCSSTFLITLSVIVLGLIGYDIYSKRVGFWKDIWVAILMTSLYPLAFSLAEANPGPRMNSLYVSPFWLFFSTLGYEMLKDIRDHRGDRVSGQKSIAMVSGEKWFLSLARCFVLLGGAISLVPYWLGYCRAVYLGFCVVAFGLSVGCICLKSFRGLSFLYGAISLVTLGAFADLMVYGSLK